MHKDAQTFDRVGSLYIGIERDVNAAAGVNTAALYGCV